MLSADAGIPIFREPAPKPQPISPTFMGKIHQIPRSAPFLDGNTSTGLDAGGHFAGCDL
jgi:hypothetical protein